MSVVLACPRPAHAATNSVIIPMIIRPADTTETQGLESLLEPTVYPQFGPNVNTGFSETAKNYHTGRSWVLDAQTELQSCDTNVVFSIEGNHKFTHVANSGPLINASDEPEVGGLVVDGKNSQMLEDAIADDVDMPVGKTYDVVAPPVGTTVAVANSGIKVVMYVETRDDISQRGVQASFTFSGTAQLHVTYDHSGCESTTTTTAPSKKTPVKSSATTAPTTQAPVSVEGESIQQNAFVMGKKAVNGTKHKSIEALAKASKPVIHRPGGNAVVNGLTFGTLVLLLGVGLFIFITKQRNMRKEPEARMGRT